MSDNYTAWDGNEYPWPPPEGWEIKSDGRYWPADHGAAPASEQAADVAGGIADADVTAETIPDPAALGLSGAADAASDAMPNVDVPNVDMPDVDTSSLEAPSFETPSFETPAVEVPGAVDIPAPGAIVDAGAAMEAPAPGAAFDPPPAMDAPSFDTPSFETPSMDASSMDAPAVDAPSFDPSSFTPPPVDAPSMAPPPGGGFDAPPMNTPGMTPPPMGAPPAAGGFTPPPAGGPAPAPAPAWDAAPPVGGPGAPAPAGPGPGGIAPPPEKKGLSTGMIVLFVILGLLVLGIGGCIVAVTAAVDEAGDQLQEFGEEFEQNQAEARREVSLSECSVIDGVPQAVGTVANRSGGLSDYTIEVVFTAEDGRQLAPGNVVVNSVADGSDIVFDAISTESGVTTRITCGLGDITRLAG